MYKIVIPSCVVKELEKIDKASQKLIFEKIKDLEKGYFSADKPLKGKHKVNTENDLAITESYT